MTKKVANLPVRYTCYLCTHYIPTLALSKSGLWVEGVSFLSACQHKLPY